MEDNMAVGRRLSDQDQAEANKKQENIEVECDDSLSTSKKRKREGDEEDVVLSPETLSRMSRSERKRHRYVVCALSSMSAGMVLRDCAEPLKLGFCIQFDTITHSVFLSTVNESAAQMVS